MYRIDELIHSGNRTLINGAWLPSRPVPFYSFPARLRDAWAVLRYRADAVAWPEPEPEYERRMAAKETE